MNYFTNFPTTQYRFGSNNTTQQVVFQDITSYVDIIDQIKDRITSYSYYHIVDGDRPDQLAERFYRRPDYHWLFFQMNDHIRESGWPLKQTELDAWLTENYTGIAITTRDDFWGTIPEGSNTPGDTLHVGDTLTGSISGITSTVTGLDPDNGQVFLDGSNLYSVGEAATWVDRGTTRTLIISSSTTRINSIDHFEDANGDQIDIDPTVGGGSNTEVNIKDMVMRRNDELKQIRVIKPRIVETIVQQHNSVL